LSEARPHGQTERRLGDRRQVFTRGQAFAERNQVHARVNGGETATETPGFPRISMPMLRGCAKDEAARNDLIDRREFVQRNVSAVCQIRLGTDCQSCAACDARNAKRCRSGARETATSRPYAFAIVTRAKGGLAFRRWPFHQPRSGPNAPSQIDVAFCKPTAIPDFISAGRLQWCGRGDSNPHPHTGSRFSCHFDFRRRLAGVRGLDYPFAVAFRP
jgi:hypothetical protein